MTVTKLSYLVLFEDLLFEVLLILWYKNMQNATEASKSFGGVLYLGNLKPMGRPYKKDAYGLFVPKEVSIYAGLRPVEES